jgi:hypothetical protein
MEQTTRIEFGLINGAYGAILLENTKDLGQVNQALMFGNITLVRRCGVRLVVI